MDPFELLTYIGDKIKSFFNICFVLIYILLGLQMIKEIKEYDFYKAKEVLLIIILIIIFHIFSMKVMLR
jgi:phosphatidylserine synthase